MATVQADLLGLNSPAEGCLSPAQRCASSLSLPSSRGTALQTEPVGVALLVVSERMGLEGAFFVGLTKCTKCRMLIRHLTDLFFTKNLGVWQGL